MCLEAPQKVDLWNTGSIGDNPENFGLTDSLVGYIGQSKRSMLDHIEVALKEVDDTIKLIFRVCSAGDVANHDVWLNSCAFTEYKILAPLVQSKRCDIDLGRYLQYVLKLRIDDLEKTPVDVEMLRVLRESSTVNFANRLLNMERVFWLGSARLPLGIGPLSNFFRRETVEERV